MIQITFSYCRRGDDGTEQHGKRKEKEASKKTGKSGSKGDESLSGKSKQEMYADFVNIVLPIAEQNAFLQMIYLTLMTARDKFGFGKERLTRLADGIINSYECILSGHVTLQEMSDEIYRITEHRFELSEDDLLDMAKKAVGEEGK